MSFLTRGSQIKIQPWSEFVELDRFGFPDSKDMLNRVNTNLEFYTGNYLVIVAVVLLLTLFSNTALLLTVLIFGGIAYFLFFIRSNTIDLGGFVLNLVSQAAILSVISVYFIYRYSGLTLFYTTLLSLVVVLVHAFLRKRSIKSKVNNLVNEADDILKNN
ncbi:PRA1 family protein 2 [Tieghemostelium lacteum]|uniref:PRA1 family protein n=1 Tax=Tieghemostelium lacteum TaxID=361077 RepID=A0A151ZHD2_TIELA|nr:PRA1 family protein 2 [Tieghemostelium lacteum]|eukprot:KYQ93398.1 PRA1 family protein 2 [Tieghemostelium lacteum]